MSARAVAAALLVCAGSIAATAVAHGQGADGLRWSAYFEGIASRDERSVALFVEAGKVIRHPRCVNCHPQGDRPLQGTGHPHQPPVERGPSGHGVPGMECSTCHQRANFDPGRVPGDPEWRLAPREMGWQNRSLGEICRQVVDRKRNGDRSLDDIVHHMATDHLVGWAWKPGAGRDPAPGTQAIFGNLIKEWAASGAVCPRP